MSNNHVAVVRRSNPDDLQHYKYVKKYKSNGKWVYVYDPSELRRAEKGISVTENIGGNKFTTHYSKTNRLYSGRVTSLVGNTSTTHRSIGKIDRARGKLEKKVYDKILKKNSDVRVASRKIKTLAKKGKKTVDKLFNRLK